jgi:uncharacterized membrane protein YphA (DoxX/SURF4 family)
LARNPDYGRKFWIPFDLDNNEEERNMNFLSSLSPHVHWGLRLSLAATFIYHGWVKFPIEGPMMGIPVAVIWLLALGEIAAGVF